MDNVVAMPPKADLIAKHIHADICGMRQAESNWAEYVLSLCQHVAEARGIYSADKDFGAWWDAQDFGLGYQERAALVKMGANIDAARKCLGETESRSIRLIASNEFPRFDSAVKPQEAPPATSKPLSEQAKPKKRGRRVEQTNDEQDERKEDKIIADVLASGGDVPTSGELAEQYGFSSRAADNLRRAVVAGVNAVRDHAADFSAAPVTRDDLPEDMRGKFDRAVKRAIAELQKQYHSALKAEVAEMVEKTLFPEWKRKIEFAERYSEGRRHEQFPFTREQFKKVLVCLHPDRIQDETLKARYAEAFSIFKEKEDSLVMPEPPTGGPSFPADASSLVK